MNREMREWYALHVRSGTERDVLQAVAEIGDVDALTPIETSVIVTPRGRRERERVLMPGYVFACGVMTPELWQRLRHTPGVLRILGEPHYAAIPPEQMAAVMALYWHCVGGTHAVRQDGVTRIIGGPLLEVPHRVTCAEPRQGRVTVELDLPGGAREVTVHARFDAVRPGLNKQYRDGGG